MLGEDGELDLFSFSDVEEAIEAEDVELLDPPLDERDEPIEEPEAEPEVVAEEPATLAVEPSENGQADYAQEALFDLEDLDWWRKHWVGMPSFVQEDLTPWQSVVVHFASRADRDAFSKLVGQKISDGGKRTRSIWHPEAEIGRMANKRFVRPAGALAPKYPIYVISKGRWERRLTIRALEAMGVPYRVVIEEPEFDRYAENVAEDKLLVLPFADLGQGSIPARNFVWEHARESGAARHWILDDNLDGFFRLFRNIKTPARDGTIFRVAEDFVDRYENVPMSGFNYFMFASRKTIMPPLYLNTRVYSCILLDNSEEEFRWRGRYNEDTDLSIRFLKRGDCTVLFNAFLCLKQTTMTMKGGNTQDLYEVEDGRRKMAESLVAQHPDVARVSEKWDRVQHHVDYSPFKRNKLRLREDVSIEPGVDEFGMEIQDLVEGEWITREREEV